MPTSQLSIAFFIRAEFLDGPSSSYSENSSVEGETLSSNLDPQPQPSSMSDETTTVSSDVPTPQPQSSPTLDETIVATVSSDVPLNLFLPQPSISSPPFEDVDQVHHNQDFDNAGDSHFHHFDCISWSSENNSDAENFPFSAFNCSDSPATSSFSTRDLQKNWPDYDVVIQRSLVNRTKAKLQKSRKNTRRTSYSTSRRPKHDQDTLNPDELSSESVKVRGSKSKANRYECEACKKTFARRADVPRHMRSACPVLGKTHLQCEGCGRPYSRPDAIQRHRRTGDCDESMFALKQGRKR